MHTLLPTWKYAHSKNNWVEMGKPKLSKTILETLSILTFNVRCNQSERPQKYEFNSIQMLLSQVLGPMSLYNTESHL